MGAFSTVAIVKGATLGEYTGEVLTRKEVEARYWGLRKENKHDRTREIREYRVIIYLIWATTALAKTYLLMEKMRMLVLGVDLQIMLRKN